MTISIKILETDVVIKRRIMKAVAKEVNVIFNKAKPRIFTEMQKLTEKLLFASPEIQSLQGGDLQAVFGIRKGEEDSVVYAIVKAVSSSVKVENIVISARSSMGLRGGMKIYIQPDDFSNLLSLPEGYVFYGEGDANTIPWLQWLLTLGDKILIGDYHFEAKDMGRSTMGIMVPKGTFRVPPSYSGTEDNNFITRAFARRAGEIAKAIQRSLR